MPPAPPLELPDVPLRPLEHRAGVLEVAAGPKLQVGLKGNPGLRGLVVPAREDVGGLLGRTGGRQRGRRLWRHRTDYERAQKRRRRRAILVLVPPPVGAAGRGEVGELGPTAL